MEEFLCLSVLYYFLTKDVAFPPDGTYLKTVAKGSLTQVMDYSLPDLT